MALGSKDAGHYTRVKAGILHRYEVNVETRRHRFRSDKKDPEESYRSFVYRTVDNFDRWMKGQKLSIMEVMIKEYILLGVPAEMTVWLEERNPKNLDELRW